MNYVTYIKDEIFQKFRIEVNVFVSKKKKLVHFAFYKPLMSYPFFHDIINLVADPLEGTKIFFQHLQNDLSKVKCQYEMEKLLWENKKCFVGQYFKKNFPEQLFITNITESKGGSYYLMIRKKHGKVVGEIRKKCFIRLKIFVTVFITTILKDTILFYGTISRYFCLLILKHEYFCKFIYSSNY